MFEISVVLTVVCTLVASVAIGIIYTKRLMRNRYADMVEVLGQPDLAVELRRDDKPVVSNHFQAALGGVIVALVINLACVVILYFIGQDLFEHRRMLMPFLASDMLLGFGAAGLAGWIVQRNRR